MARAAKRNLAIVAVLCTLVGIGGWAFYAAVFRHEPGEDWLVFHTAARAYLDGDPGLIRDGARFTTVLNERFADWLGDPLTLHPWVYPPSFLLLLLPFGLVPAGAALALFLAVTFGGLLCAARGLACDPQQRRLYEFTVLFCPAVASTVFTGQNAFLTAALLLGGLTVAERRPWLGGALLGLVTLKPQLALMVPVALLGARDWRALAGAAAAAGVLALASLAVFGAEAWHDWLGLATGSSELYAGWLAAGRLKGVSVFACATLLGASPAVANLAQAAAVMVAVAAVFRVFQQGARRELKIAAALAGTILAAPHGSMQDGLLLGLAAAAFLAAALEDGLGFGDAVLAAALWTSPLFNPPSLFRIGLLTPALVALFLVRVVVKARPRVADVATALGETAPAS
jgi:hypothetical protein